LTYLYDEYIIMSHYEIGLYQLNVSPVLIE
jgi:hypothetical protein